MPAQVLFDLMVKIVIMVLFGFVLRKTGIVDEDFQQKLSRMLVQAVFPINVIVAGNSPATGHIMGNLPWAALIIATYYTLSFCVITPLSRTLPLNRAQRATFINCSIFSNLSFIGFPIISTLYGDEGLIYAILFSLGYNLFTSVVGMQLYPATPKIQFPRMLKDPFIISSVLSILIFISPFRLPGAILSPLNSIGSMMIPLSMLIIGCSLADMRLRNLLRDKWTYLVLLVRMILLPLIMLFTFSWLKLRGILPATCVVLTSLPPGTLNAIFAKQHGGDAPFATRAAILGMLLMLPLLPVFMWLISVFL